MNFIIPYAVQNRQRTPALCGVSLDGEIGARCDRFAYERLSGPFAVKEILCEAEECIRDKYDDELTQGLWRGEFWGKQILSAVRVCRQKNDEALKEAIRASCHRILAMQDGDGYIGSYRDSADILPADRERCIREVGWGSTYNWNVWGQKYTLWALLESAMLLDERRILTAAGRLADQLIRRLRQKGVTLRETGVMHGMAACSILKPMLILYRLTGERSYYDLCLETASDWTRPDGAMPNLIANALSGRSPARWYPHGDFSLGGWTSKAYEMMSCFDGLIELYRVSGDGTYLAAAERFWDAVRRDETNILGSVGYCERFWMAASYPDAATEVCDVVHWMRLCHELFCLTGEAKYMDAFERAFLNAFLAGVYEDGRTGAFFVRSAGRHWTAEPQVETKYQHCCLNNAARGFVNAAESVMTRCAAGYCVNLYVPARVRFGEAAFRISSGYTDHGEVTVTVRGAAAGERLRLRVPDWSAVTRIGVVGGEEREAEAVDGYVTVTLDGTDTVFRLRFDMTPEVIDFRGEYRDLPPDDYHVQRWIDGSGGLCDRRQMAAHPVSVIRCGPVMLARTKRLGASEEMFGEESVCGHGAACTARVIRHDRMLTACRVSLTADGRTRELLMCDLASAVGRDTEDPRFFSMYV